MKKTAGPIRVVCCIRAQTKVWGGENRKHESPLSTKVVGRGNGVGWISLGWGEKFLQRRECTKLVCWTGFLPPGSNPTHSPINASVEI